MCFHNFTYKEHFVVDVLYGFKVALHHFRMFLNFSFEWLKLFTILQRPLRRFKLYLVVCVGFNSIPQTYFSFFFQFSVSHQWSWSPVWYLEVGIYIIIFKIFSSYGNDLKFKAFVDEEGNKFPLLIPSSKLRQDWSVIFLKIMPCIVLFIRAYVW